MQISLLVAFVAITLVAPLVVGILTYTRTGLRSFLQIPFALIFVPVGLGLLLVILYAWTDAGAPRWIVRLPQVAVVPLLIDAVRRLERQFS